MTLLLSADDVVDLATDDLALDAVRLGFDAEALGRTVLPVRLDAPSPTGFFRTMPGVLGDRMGCKIMTLVKGSGTRYLVLLYSVANGELLALVDADELTKIRTAATTVLAAEQIRDCTTRRLAVIGSGFEARGHLGFFARRWKLDTVAVHSRSPENRRTFSREMSEKIGIDVREAVSLDDALDGADTVLLATKSPDPVVDGNRIASGAVVLSIGSTRPDLRELDRASFERAGTVVVDALEQVVADSGDVIDALASGVIDRSQLCPLSDLVARRRKLTEPVRPRDLMIFKSAGTALQDLALADAVFSRAVALERGTDIGDVSRLKPFNGNA